MAIPKQKRPLPDQLQYLSQIPPQEQASPSCMKISPLEMATFQIIKTQPFCVNLFDFVSTQTCKSTLNIFKIVYCKKNRIWTLLKRRILSVSKYVIEKYQAEKKSLFL